MKTFKRASLSNKIFYITITLILSLFFIAVLYPCIFVISASFSESSAVQSGKVILWPVGFSLEGYKGVFSASKIWIGFRNTIFYTVVGTVINLIFTVTTGYCMSRNDLPGRNIFMLYFTFTMFFSGGMVTNYLLMVNLGMINTIWAILIPGALGVYYVIVTKTFIQSSIPNELLEASQMDGCSDFMYYIRVVLPLSKSVIAVLVLFFGVGHWNAYFSALMYLHNEDMYPVTLFLREILMLEKMDPSMITDPELQEKVLEMVGVLKYALIVVSSAPIIMLYPFVQKHFVKGVMIGSVKG